jgi:hypothetical protein
MKKVSVIFLMSCLLSSVRMAFCAEGQKTLSLKDKHALHLKRGTEKNTWTCWYNHPGSSFAASLIATTPGTSSNDLKPLIRIATLFKKQHEYSTTDQNLPIVNITLDSHHLYDGDQFTIRMETKKKTLIKDTSKKEKPVEISQTIVHDDTYKKHALLKEGLFNILAKNCSELIFIYNSEQIAILKLDGCLDLWNQWLEKKNKNDSSLEQEQPETMESIIAHLKNQQQDAIQKKTLQPEEKKSFFLPLIGGVITGMLALYAVSKLEYWNKNLAPSMEAFFTRLLSSCQGMFSRISSHTNNLRA